MHTELENDKCVACVLHFQFVADVAFLEERVIEVMLVKNGDFDSGGNIYCDDDDDVDSANKQNITLKKGIGELGVGRMREEKMK